jgi:putative nucleotidyltransferase with HDIG domain
MGTLSRKPSSGWAGGLLHHGARLLLLLVVAALITSVFPPQERQSVARYAVGEVAEQAVLARIAFTVPKPEEELERERAEVRATVPPTFEHRLEATDSMTLRLERFFAALDSLRRLPDTAPMLAYLEQRSVSPTMSEFELLRDEGALQTLRNSSLRAAREILPAGVADAAGLEGLTTSVVVVREPGGSERSVGRGSVLARGEFLERGLELLPARSAPELQQLLRLILIQHMEYSLELNEAATEQDREAAGRAVPVSIKEVMAGEAIVRANEQITPATAAVLDAHAAALVAAGISDGQGFDPISWLGAGLLNLMLLGVFGLFVLLYRNPIYTNFRWVLLIVLLIVAYFAVASIIAHNDLSPELLPVAFVALSAGVLWDGRMALVLVALLAVLTGVQQPFASTGVIATTFLGGAAAALSARAVRRRAQTWVFVALITAAYTLGLVAMALIYDWTPAFLGRALLAAAGNATLSAVLAMGFVPLFEMLTRITTDQTLLEWADPNRSLLKQLSLEAPGTYAHTINVANLAEAAANSIGANGLLCRVGLYYHDVGKMQRPQYFVENQREGKNPHDLLRPDTSAAIVKEHVVEGLRLAREAKVPEVVAAFIPEHHGTQRIGFFWEKAREMFGEEQLNVEDFTYPGPKPQSRETAVAMLADSVESSMRALQDPTPERVRDLVEGIVDAKIDAGQLDESPLTLQELRRIKEQFIQVMSGIHHYRIDYPQTRHLTEAPEPLRKPELTVHSERTRFAGRRGGEPAPKDDAAPSGPAKPEGEEPGGGGAPRARGSGR